MKEKDFDDIGKRLYNQEADPPKDGMKKIHSILQGTEKSGKVISIGKGWWKPLLLVAPLIMYWVYTEWRVNQAVLATSVKDSVLPEAARQNKQESRVDEVEINGVQSTGSMEQKQTLDSGEDETPEQAYSSTNPGNSIGQNTQKATVNKSENQLRNLTDLPINHKALEEVKIMDSTSYQSPTESMNNNGSQKFTVRVDESTQTGKPDSSQQQGMMVVSKNKTHEIRSTQLESMDQVIVQSINPEKQDLPDSANNTAYLKENASRLRNASWRINASFAPHYLTQPVQPDTNDEVLVTDINTTNKSYRMGFGIGIGVGKEIGQDFYLDGHLTYTDIRQNLKLSYTTGNIDTLLAIQQPDQSVVIVPVYESTEREMSNHYGYAGLRVEATYYFWKKVRSRFNLTASAGFHYLVLADIREKTGGEWVSLSDEDLNRQNFSLAIGAGYNINFKQGWELRINPVLTYFTKKVKNQALPYTFNQQLIGLNLMLSKTLGSKN